MKSAFAVLVISILLAGCDFTPKPHDQMIDEVREEVVKDSEIRNSKTFAWDNFIDSIYHLAELNPKTAQIILDSAIFNAPSDDQHQIYELHFVKGDIYYRSDSLEKAVAEFNICAQEYVIETPKVLAARAGASVKLKRYESAFTDLYQASEINHGYLWNLGNFYELAGYTDSAVACYTRLYYYDTATYKYSMDRAAEIKKPNVELMTELEFRDRNRVTIAISAPK